MSDLEKAENTEYNFYFSSTFLDKKYVNCKNFVSLTEREIFGGENILHYSIDHKVIFDNDFNSVFCF